MDEIKFNNSGLVPAIAQEAATGQVLMLAYMNREAIEKTIETGRAHYFSRSRNELWLKGETSGHFQEVLAAYYDCDSDAILLKINQTGVACHTGEKSCFFRRLDDGQAEPLSASVISELFQTIIDRKDADPEKSYVASLYKKGEQKIAAKIHEESAEFIHAARKEGDKEITSELCDLWFHTLVMLGHKEIAIQDVYTELKRRFGTSGIEEKNSRGKKKE